MDLLRQLYGKNQKQEKDIFRLKQRHLGMDNRDKTIYYICENNENTGFFATYRYWLEYLYYADICGYTPVIDAGKKFAYAEETAVNGKRNPFEYYFCQPAGIELKEAKSSSRVIISECTQRKMVELIYTGKTNHYSYTDRYLEAMSQMADKYIRYNERTQNYINAGIKKLEIQNQKVLGVHIRGTDFRAKYNNHPVYLTEEDCFLEIDMIQEKNHYDKIFIATDDKRVLEKFMKKYRDKICFYDDVVRGDKNKSVVFLDNSRKGHKYLLGLEVIRDMHTLSKCDALVAGLSQVAICALINKLSLGEMYTNLRMIDKGIYKSNRHFRV